MKNYQINVLVETHDEVTIEERYIKTDAEKLDVQKAIDFVKLGGDKNVQSLLIALRVLGFTAREVKIDVDESFDM